MPWVTVPAPVLLCRKEAEAAGRPSAPARPPPTGGFVLILEQPQVPGATGRSHFQL